MELSMNLTRMKEGLEEYFGPALVASPTMLLFPLPTQILGPKAVFTSLWLRVSFPGGYTSDARASMFDPFTYDKRGLQMHPHVSGFFCLGNESRINSKIRARKYAGAFADVMAAINSYHRGGQFPHRDYSELGLDDCPRCGKPGGRRDSYRCSSCSTSLCSSCMLTMTPLSISDSFFRQLKITGDHFCDACLKPTMIDGREYFLPDNFLELAEEYDYKVKPCAGCHRVITTEGRNRCQCHKLTLCWSCSRGGSSKIQKVRQWMDGDGVKRDFMPTCWHCDIVIPSLEKQKEQANG